MKKITTETREVREARDRAKALIANVLRDVSADRDTMIEIWDRYCQSVNGSTAPIYRMTDFNKWNQHVSETELAYRVAHGNFNVGHEYWKSNGRGGYDSAPDYRAALEKWIDFDDIARGAVCYNNDYGVDGIREILDAYTPRRAKNL